MNPQADDRGCKLARTGIALVALVLSACAGKAAQADPTDAQARARHRAEIEHMTETERARLKHNFAEFRKLPPEEQERLRRLDRELKEDRRNGGDLQQVMADYVDWLDTLSPGQREDLHREATPDGRERLVRRLISEQHERAELPGRRGGFRGLSPADLDAVLATVEKKLLEVGPRSSPQIAELKDMQGLKRHATIVDLAFGRRGSDPGRVAGLLMPPPEGLVEEMTERIGNPEQKRLVLGAEPPRRTMMLMMLIWRGLWAEFESIKPSEDTLANYLAGLSGEQQAEILRLTPEAQQRELMRRYMEEHPDEFPRPPRGGWFDDFSGGRRWRGPGGGNRENPGRREPNGPEARPNPGNVPPERPGRPRERGRGERNRSPDA